MKGMKMMGLKKRIEMERRLVRKLVRSAKAAGWSAYAVDDGGDELIRPKSEAEVMDAVFAVDQCHIYFRKEVNGKALKGWAFIVLGNDGWDAICDNGIGPFNDEVVEKLDWYINKLEAEAA